MRVTQSMLANNMLRNLMQSQVKLDRYMEQLYTGKKIRRPSDDPVVAIKGMGYRTQVLEVEQFQRNVSEVRNWMDQSESVLNEGIQVLQRIRELAVQASNSTNSPDELQSIKKEIEQLRSHLIDLGNTKVNDRYIFNGTKTDERPILMDAENNIISLPEDSSPIEVEVYQSIHFQVNVLPEQIFNEDLFQTIDALIGELDVYEEDDLAQQIDLESLDRNINNFIHARSDIGARMNRLELIEYRLGDQEVIATRTMSDNEDIHFEEAITNLITQETLYRAALATGSRIIQPTLMDFLR